MKGMTLSAMAYAVSGVLYNFENENLDKEASSVVIDSRLIEEDGVFVATVGERTDGHKYIDQVFENGAFAVICEKLPDKPKGPCIVVKDSFIAIKELAKYYRSQLDVKIVGIVGSVGKTSTKEMVASVLESRFSVLKTDKNYNNEVGVPLTIFRIRDEHEVAVVEMGISDFHEMDRLGAIVRPDYVVFTCIGPCHLEQLVDLDGVLKAKTEVIPYVNEEGTIFINGQDEKLALINADMAQGRNVCSFGRADKDQVQLKSSESLGLDGTSFVVKLPDNNEYNMTVPLPGVHMIDNALAALAVGYTLGLNPEEMRRGLYNVTALSGRGHLIHTDKYVIVDDCYNASPKSMCAAIDTMQYALSRKVAILGDMFELGEDTNALHAQVGRYAAENGIDSLICVGTLSKYIYEAARVYENLEIRYYPTKQMLIDAVSDANKQILKQGDTVLVKASHGMGFAEVVETLSNL